MYAEMMEQLQNKAAKSEMPVVQTICMSII
jgi:hypothetical protein